MYYGADVESQYRRVAGFVDRILRGASPADLAIQEPTKFDLVVNRKVADELGLTVPESILRKPTASSYPFLGDAGSCPGNFSGMGEATGAPSSFAV